MLSTWSATEVAFLLVAVIQTVATLLWLIVARVVPGARRAAVHWAAYAALSAVTWTVLAMRLQSPPLFGVVAGVIATLALQRGIWVFIDRTPTYRAGIAAIVAVVAVGVIGVDRPLEVAVNFGVLALLCLAIARDLYRHARDELRLHWPLLLSAAVLLGSLGFGSRAIRALVRPDSVIAEMVTNSSLNVGTALAYVVLVLSLHATLMALVVGRLVKVLAELSRHDGLTGLLNRRAIQDELEAQLQRSRRAGEAFAVMMLDVDKFKSINDRFGHVVGDRALKHVASLLALDLRAVDRVGRFGGEEFLVMLPGAHLAQAEIVAERLRDAVGSAQLPEVTIPLSISIGVAEWTAGDEQVSQLLVRADDALYRAKSAGRNRVVVAPEAAKPEPDV